MIEKLTQRLTLFKRIVSESKMGDVSESYREVKKVWGSLVPLIGKDGAQEQLGKEKAVAKYILTLRTPCPRFHRVTYGSMHFNLCSAVFESFTKRCVTVIVAQL